MRLEYFQMIDSIVDADRGARRLRAACTIPTESTIFEGHFPGYPLMPGVLLTECMAQTTGWLICMLGDFSAMPFLAGIKEAKFRTLVFPGDALEFEGSIVHEGSGYTVAECKGLRGGSKVCDAELTFRIRPYPSPEFRQSFFEWGKRLNLPIPEFVK
ncbi:MAG: 3-hydroxyacyl-ACP dehydratase FabZ family protein [Xanthobacteraceae bacterium]|jgi:3-hydroxyacyl-[acyl-carrier-protein] dehydratase